MNGIQWKTLKKITWKTFSMLCQCLKGMSAWRIVMSYINIDWLNHLIVKDDIQIIYKQTHIAYHSNLEVNILCIVKWRWHLHQNHHIKRKYIRSYQNFLNKLTPQVWTEADLNLKWRQFSSLVEDWKQFDWTKNYHNKAYRCSQIIKTVI